MATSSPDINGWSISNFHLGHGDTGGVSQDLLAGGRWVIVGSHDSFEAHEVLHLGTMGVDVADLLIHLRFEKRSR